MAKPIPRIPCGADTCGDLFPKCGKYSTYAKLRCRCEACAVAAREYRRKKYASDSSLVLQRNEKWRDRNADSVRSQKRQYYRAHREAIAEYKRGYYLENKDFVLAQNVRSRSENGAKWAAARRLRYQENRDTIREQMRQKYAEDPNKGSHNRARRARKMRAFVEHVDRIVVFQRDNWICQQCGVACRQDAVWPEPDYPSLDHVVALANGGLHSYDNCQLLCLRCNLIKGARY